MDDKKIITKTTHKKTIRNLFNIENKKVILRVDFNVPIKNGKILSNMKIVESIPTIEHLLKNGAKLIILSHLGRIKTNDDKKDNSLAIVAEELEKLLEKQIKSEVTFVDETRGKKLEESISKMKTGSILIIENTRFEDVNKENHLVNKETNNDKELSKYWASLGDLFVNDAFGTLHRQHASNYGIASLMKETAIGFLIEKEIKNLSKVIDKPERPLVTLLGGAKISDKIELIESLLKASDKVIIGSAMCYTFYLAQGKKVGKSNVDESKIPLAKKLLKQYGDKLILTNDSLCVKELGEKIKPQICGEIPDGLIGVSIGPESVKMIKRELKGAKTVIWNGPFGVIELNSLKKQTEKVVKVIAKLKNATTIIGGGDSALMINRMKERKKITHISTGGGSTIEFLKGKEMPSLDIINDI